MKKFLVITVLILAAALIAVLSVRDVEPEVAQVDFPKASDMTPKSISDRAFADYGKESLAASDDLVLVNDLVRKFFTVAKSNANRYPMGTNREITRVLAGHNPVGFAWIPPNHPSINPKGELTDRWDKPLHFHGLGGGAFEIRSGGPDGILYTDDDIKVGGSNRRGMQL